MSILLTSYLITPIRRSEKGSKYTQSYKNIKYIGSLVKLLYSRSTKQPENIFVQKGGPLAALRALTTAVSGLQSRQHVNEAFESIDCFRYIKIQLGSEA